MPGFDGTGPNGAGRVTGGGRGYCVNSSYNRGPRYGLGRGSGFMRGRGRGFMRGNQYFNSSNYQNYNLTVDEEKENLKTRIVNLESQLKEASEYLKSLDKGESENK